MADLIKYIPVHLPPEKTIDRTYVANEWRKIKKQSTNPDVQAAALIQLSVSYSRYGKNGTAAMLLDTLDTQYGITQNHGTYGNTIRTILDKMTVQTIGRSLDNFETVDIDGNIVTSADFEDKIVLLYFYGSGCGSCVKVYPMLNKLFRKYQGENFYLLGISTDANFYTEEEFRNRIRKYNIKWPQTLADSLFDKYHVSFLSTVFLLNKKSQIVLTSRGYDILQAKNLLKDKELEEAIVYLIES